MNDEQRHQIPDELISAFAGLVPMIMNLARALGSAYHVEITPHGSNVGSAESWKKCWETDRAVHKDWAAQWKAERDSLLGIVSKLRINETKLRQDLGAANNRNKNQGNTIMRLSAELREMHSRHGNEERSKEWWDSVAAGQTQAAPRLTDEQRIARAAAKIRENLADPNHPINRLEKTPEPENHSDPKTVSVPNVKPIIPPVGEGPIPPVGSLNWQRTAAVANHPSRTGSPAASTENLWQREHHNKLIELITRVNQAETALKQLEENQHDDIEVLGARQYNDANALEARIAALEKQDRAQQAIDVLNQLKMPVMACGLSKVRMHEVHTWKDDGRQFHCPGAYIPTAVSAPIGEPPPEYDDPPDDYGYEPNDIGDPYYETRRRRTIKDVDTKGRT